jgi:hypothetical protein
MWAYAREGSAKEQMRFCYENRNATEISVAYDSVTYSSELWERFSPDEMYDRFVGEIESVFPENTLIDLESML